jgi:hypothetical protein
MKKLAVALTACLACSITQSETYNCHRLDLTRQSGFMVTIHDEDRLGVAATISCSTPAEAFASVKDR